MKYFIYVIPFILSCNKISVDNCLECIEMKIEAYNCASYSAILTNDSLTYLLLENEVNKLNFNISEIDEVCVSISKIDSLKVAFQDCVYPTYSYVELDCVEPINSF